VVVSVAYAANSSSGSFLFPTRTPVILLGCVLGLGGCAVQAARCWISGRTTPAAWLSIGLGLTPILFTNQQLLTGRTMFLMNYDNFIFPQMATLSWLIACFGPASHGQSSDSPPWAVWIRRWAGRGAACLVLAGLGWILATSQTGGYDAYLADNIKMQSYARALRGLQGFGSMEVACKDFYVSDTLALLLDRRPDWLLSQDMVFSRPMDRMRTPGDIPKGRAPVQARLFEYLAVTGASPKDFEDGFRAVVDPTLPDWQSRFMIGDFLFNPADYWGIFTMHRDTRSSWISGQQPGIMKAYRDYLERGDWPAAPVLLVGQDLTGTLERVRRSGASVRKIGSSLGLADYPLEAAVISSRPAPGN
jgi:hypothetical protein